MEKSKMKYQVFVSSTYEDLKEERKEVTQALLENDCIPVGMELFSASNKKQWDIIKSVIDDSDYYLLIIAGRYGSCGKDEYNNTVSYTEMEFDYARRIGKPIIVFQHKDIESLPLSKSEKTQIGRQRLKKFLSKASSDREIAYWTNKDNLKAKVIQAIQAIIRDCPAYGWIKVNKEIEEKLSNSVDNTEKSFERLYSELFPLLVDFRESIKSTDIESINRCIDKVHSLMSSLYYMAEYNRYTDEEKSKMANVVIGKWNGFLHYYGKFVDASDRTADEAQKAAKKAEKIFSELVDLVVKNMK